MTERRPMSDSLLALARPVLAPLAERLSEPVVEQGGRLRAGPVGLDAEGLEVGRLRVTWRGVERATHASRIDDFLVVVLGFSTGGRKPLLASTWARVLADQALPGAVDVVLERGLVRIGESVTGWRTSHDYETWDEPLASFDTRGLPLDDALAGSVIAALARAVAALPPTQAWPSEGRCRFCRETFPSRDFLFHEDACHGCAVSRLGVVF